MGAYEVKDSTEVLELIRQSLTELGRDDAAYRYGVAHDHESGKQVVYFDVPRVSPLQFNIYVEPEIKTRQDLSRKIKAAITARLDLK